MPSLTPNYSWPYPISSDDLNAGATEIGNLANDIDTDLKAEENARIAAVTAEANARIAADNLRPTSNAGSLTVGTLVVTTNGSGAWAAGGLTGSNCVISNVTASGLLSAINTPDATPGVFYVAGFGPGFTIAASRTVTLSYIKW